MGHSEDVVEDHNMQSFVLCATSFIILSVRSLKKSVSALPSYLLVLRKEIWWQRQGPLGGQGHSWLQCWPPGLLSDHSRLQGRGLDSLRSTDKYSTFLNNIFVKVLSSEMWLGLLRFLLVNEFHTHQGLLLLTPVRRQGQSWLLLLQPAGHSADPADLGWGSKVAGCPQHASPSQRKKNKTHFLSVTVRETNDCM